MQFHGTLCDSESHTGASGVRASRVIDAVKRQEDGVDLIFRDTGPAIIHIEYGHRALLPLCNGERNLYLGTFFGVLNRITYDILDCPVQQLLVAKDDALNARVKHYRALPSLGLVHRIGNHLRSEEHTSELQ